MTLQLFFSFALLLLCALLALLLASQFGARVPPRLQPRALVADDGCGWGQMREIERNWQSVCEREAERGRERERWREKEGEERQRDRDREKEW